MWKGITIILVIITGTSALVYGAVQCGIMPKEQIGLVFVLVIILLVCSGIEHYLISSDFKKDIRPIENNMGFFRNVLAEIQDFLKTKYRFRPRYTVETKGYTELKSPLQLTPPGIKLLEESGGKEAIDNNYEFFKNFIDAKKPSTLLDVQEEATFIVFEAENADFMETIKRFIYNNPQYSSTDLELSDVQKVMSLYLRNKYLDEHPEINNAKDNQQN